MNLLLFTDADRIDASRITITGERLEQLRAVSGAQVGRELRAGEVNGKLGIATLDTLTSEKAVLTVTLSESPPAKLPAILVLALPRPKMLRRILRSVAEFGIAECHLVNSYRVEKSYWQTPVLAEESIRHYLLEGLAQGVDTVLPKVQQHKLFKPFVEDRLPQLVEARHALVAHPQSQAPCPGDLPGETLIVVGPEGGFTEYEIEKLKAAGCEPVGLGPRILRVENAVSRLLGKLF